MIEAILIILCSYLLGRGALRILYRKPIAHTFSREDCVLLGIVVIIGLAEVAHMGALILERPFADARNLFMAGLALLLLVSLILIVTGRRLERQNKLLTGINRKPTLLFLIFLGVVLLQLVTIVTDRAVYLNGDMTVETVNSILTENSIYQVNPMTGRAYTEGMPIRLKILCLPTLYAILCDVFGVSAMNLVWSIVPGLILLASYAAFSTVAKALFPSEEKNYGFFMLTVALLLGVGAYLYGMDGFAVQYAGFRGVSIRAAVLLPYTFGLVLRKKWRLAILCILAEACIVWTFYGMGACLVVTVGMFLAEFLCNKWMKHKETEWLDDKEDEL